LKGNALSDTKDQQCVVSGPLLPGAGCVVGKEVQGMDRHCFHPLR
jgi:hypothetical protein